MLEERQYIEAGLCARIAELESFIALSGDCDYLRTLKHDYLAAEARIAALESDLKKVKAESLRVVMDGTQCLLREVDWENYMAFWRGTVFQRDRYGDWWNLDLCSAVEMLEDKNTIVQPVRLVKWEDEG